jgi:hypothetical protein
MVVHNEDNLIPFSERSKEEARMYGKKGGIASGEARRAKRDLRKAMELLLEKEFKDAKGSSKSGAELLAFKQFQKALDGDTRAFEVVRDTAGQKPIERIEQVNISDETREQIERFLNDESEDVGIKQNKE